MIKHSVCTYDSCCVATSTLSDGSEVFDVIWDGLRLFASDESSAIRIAAIIDNLIESGDLIGWESA
jgi:hypothetical protein